MSDELAMFNRAPKTPGVHREDMGEFMAEEVASGRASEAQQAQQAQQQQQQASGQPPPDMRMIHSGRGGMPTRAQTGPKGVLADYREAKYNLQTQQLRDRIRAERGLSRQAYGATDLVSVAASAAAAARPQQQQQQKQNKRRGGDSDSSDDSDFDSDDEAVQAYMKMRKQEVQDSLPTFGTLEEAPDPNAFVYLLKSTPSNCVVVLHLYRPLNETCVRLNFALANLATYFPHVRFIRAHIDPFMPGFASGGLPVLQAYRPGSSDPIKTWLGPEHGNVFGHKFRDDEIATLLAKEGILDSTAAQQFGMSVAAGMIDTSNE